MIDPSSTSRRIAKHLKVLGNKNFAPSFYGHDVTQRAPPSSERIPTMGLFSKDAKSVTNRPAARNRQTNGK